MQLSNSNNSILHCYSGKRLCWRIRLRGTARTPGAAGAAAQEAAAAAGARQPRFVQSGKFHH